MLYYNYLRLFFKGHYTFQGQMINLVRSVDMVFNDGYYKKKYVGVEWLIILSSSTF